ncbi:MAG TPA: LysM peptidoglycan-binding domain-containing protein [Bacteroidetes bacterium]|nr:LysM peptidoglycan-binding domain-containing protein [Bacteroidota bacterium]
MKRPFLRLAAIGSFILFGTFIGLRAQAQHDSLAAFSLAEINWQLDSLLPCYHFKARDTSFAAREQLNIYAFSPDSVPAYSPEIVAQRLKDLGSPISMDYNSYVQAYINLYAVRRREQVERMLGLKEVYFPIFEEELDRQGVPIELKYLPVVESALNPHAVSRVGATGLWQFMHATGRMYKLQVTSYVDHRRDPYRSTEAAVRYLKNMYKTYGDWLLVIAAYNCGPGNVNKAIARSGGKRTFWEIRDKLPRETRGYVPAFIAATYVFNYAAEYNLYPKHVDFSFQQDTVQILRSKVSLKHLADMTNTDFYTLKDLNPELKLDIVPYSGKPYVLRVPMRTGQHMAVFRDSIHLAIAKLDADAAKATYSANRVSPLTNRPYEKPSARPTYAKGGKGAAGSSLVYHKVRSGEVVGTIAARYHVRARDIQSWNRLRGYRIKVGQRLKIYAPKRYASSNSHKKKSTTSSPTARIAGKYHVVRPGDTLWDIANAYDGLTVNKIKSLNGLRNNALQVGQQLKIK